MGDPRVCLREVGFHVYPDGPEALLRGEEQRRTVLQDGVLTAGFAGSADEGNDERVAMDTGRAQPQVRDGHARPHAVSGGVKVDGVSGVVVTKLGAGNARPHAVSGGVKVDGVSGVVVTKLGAGLARLACIANTVVVAAGIGCLHLKAGG